MGACVRPPPHPSSAARARTRCAPPPHHPAPSRRPPARCTRPRQPARRASLPPAKRSSKIQSGRADAEARAVQGGEGGGRGKENGVETQKTTTHPAKRSRRSVPTPEIAQTATRAGKKKKTTHGRGLPVLVAVHSVLSPRPPSPHPNPPRDDRLVHAPTPRRVRAGGMTRRPRRWGRRGVAKTRPGGENPGSRRRRERSPREPDTPAGPTSVSCQRRQRRGGGCGEWSGWSGSSNSSHPVLTGRGSGKRCVGYVRACPGSRLFATSFRPFFRSSAAAFSFALHSGRWTRHFW